MHSGRTMDYRAAILDALRLEMRRDQDVILIGEDVGAAGGVFKQTAGLWEEFGDARVIDTPISEPGAFGIAVGAAMAGARPVFEVMFGDFITLVMDQLVNQAAKIHYMSAGQIRVPLVLRTAVGIGANLGPQHSQSLHAWTAHVPGLKVLMPATAADAKGLMAAAIRDDNPVVFVEDRMLYTKKSEVPENEYVVPLGQAVVRREGTDVTIVAISRMVHVAMEAAELLSRDGISAEVVDLRCLVPLDTETVVNSVKKTSRAIVIDGGYRQYGITGEVAATIAEQAFDWLDAPVMRIGAEDVPIPFSKSLEPLILPDPPRLSEAVSGLVRGG